MKAKLNLTELSKTELKATKGGAVSCFCTCIWPPRDLDNNQVITSFV